MRLRPIIKVEDNVLESEQQGESHLYFCWVVWVEPGREIEGDYSKCYYSFPKRFWSIPCCTALLEMPPKGSDLIRITVFGLNDNINLAVKDRIINDFAQLDHRFETLFSLFSLFSLTSCTLHWRNWFPYCIGIRTVRTHASSWQLLFAYIELQSLPFRSIAVHTI